MSLTKFRMTLAAAMVAAASAGAPALGAQRARVVANAVGERLRPTPRPSRNKDRDVARMADAEAKRQMRAEKRAKAADNGAFVATQNWIDRVVEKQLRAA